MNYEVQQFASAPQAVGSRKKYRDPKETEKANIMHDPRVIRGNTYASLVSPQQDLAEVQKQREAQRRRLMRANQTKKRAGTPEPVVGRKHMDIQTDSYLEELTERTVEFEAETQTDFLLDRPQSPLFMPAKIGVDIDTQIEDGDLFDFDVECEPVLEVLVGKTLEQSMMEVLEEEELESLQRHQEDFEKKRNAELLEVQRMEAAEKRRQDEMERRMQQQAAQRQQDLTMMRKVVSCSIAAEHLSSLKERALAHLKDSGIFADAVQLAVENVFMPDLIKMVSKQMEKSSADRQIMGEVMQSAVTARVEAHGKALDVERRRIAAIDQAEREARIEKEEERLAKEKEAAKAAAEKQAQEEWEAFVPEPPPSEELPVVELVDGEEGAKAVVFEDSSKLPVPGDKVQEVTDMLAAVAEAAAGQKVVAKVVEVSEGTKVIESFRVAEASEFAAPPADGEGEGEAPAADAE